jgi:hypothetical protein
MTQQLDMIPTPIAEDARVLERIADQLPKARDVSKRRLPEMFHVERADAESTSRHDVGHELVLPERAREDHR